MTSILTTIKKMLGIEEAITHFDSEIIVNINSVCMGLSQIGVLPVGGYFIIDSSDTWAELIDDKVNIEAVKTYIYLKVKLLFDPPSSSFVIDAIERQALELEWRLNTQISTVIE